VNRSVLLHIVERLEALMGKLPGAIQRPVLHELVPLKELFLQQRTPRLLLAGSDRLRLPELISLIFQGKHERAGRDVLFEIFRWQTLQIDGRGSIAVLDARGADEEAETTIREELKREPADVILIASEDSEDRTSTKRSAENGSNCVHWNDAVHPDAGIIAIHLDSMAKSDHNGERPHSAERIQLQRHARFWGSFEFVPVATESSTNRAVAQQFIALLAKRLPNACRVEIVRSSRDRVAQREISQVLIKSSSAIATAIGTQPLPLADLPVLTTVQLVMVSGIMYLSGRERSMRAATEFVGALGANVGVGMLLREGARAMLKFVPGWGNVICGMIAGAGTYAIGQAAATYFLEGATLAEARRTNLKRLKRKRPLTLADR
jgi:uncharacterized protein (DUF697 family)